MAHEVLLKKLVDSWKAQGVSIRKGASSDSLAALEQRYGIELPRDFRDYLLAFNGMEPDDWDQEMIRFWPVEEIAAVESLESYLVSPREASLSLVFADWSLDCHLYSLDFFAEHGFVIFNQIA